MRHATDSGPSTREPHDAPLAVERSLRHRHRRLGTAYRELANVVASLDLAIVNVDGDGRVRAFTPRAAAILDLTAAKVGLPIQSLDPTLTVTDLASRVAQVRRDGASSELEVQDRRGRWFRLELRPCSSHDDRPGGVVLSLVDIDALKRTVGVGRCSDRSVLLRDVAAEAERNKDALLAVLSHELRNPLHAILGCAEMIQGDPTDVALVESAAAVITRAAVVQNQLLSDLLDDSAMSAGTLRVTLQPVRLATIISGAVEIVRGAAEAKGIRLRVKPPAADIQIAADATRLHQIFWNLLSNAVKFTPQGGRMIVRALRSAAGIAIQVGDSGSGIAPSLRPRIFDRFFQGEDAPPSGHAGIGLGLTIVRDLVTLHGGQVFAGDRRGPGAVFTVLLPPWPDQGVAALA